MRRLVRIVTLLLFTAVALYLLLDTYWDQYLVESFCEDQAVIGSPSDGLAANAAAMGLLVRAGPTMDETTGMILVHKESLLATYYCDIQHVAGKVISKSSGSF